jgi:hypothetical protein
MRVARQALAGQLVALALMLLMQNVLFTSAQIERWGWRIPFVVGGALALFALYMRRNVTETEAFKHSARQAAPSIGQQMLQHWRQIALAIGITAGGTVGFYTYTVYMQKYLVNSVGLSKETSTLISAGALLLYMPLQPLFGLASDVFGRRPVLICFGVLYVLFGTAVRGTQPYQRSAGRLPAVVRRTRDAKRLHVGPHAREDRTVSGAHPCTRSRLAVRADNGDSRRHDRVRRTALQGKRSRTILLLVRHRVGGRVASRLYTDARDLFPKTSCNRMIAMEPRRSKAWKFTDQRTRPGKHRRSTAAARPSARV